MRSLGREVDVVQSSFSTPRWGDACQKLLIVNVPFYIDVPRTSPLARKSRITVADLEGMRLRVLRHGNDAMDSLRIDLLADGGVDVIDVDSFDFALFNEAEEKGDAVLTCGAWSGVHPAFVGVPFLCGREVPVYLHYPLEPTLQVQKFVNAMAQLLNSSFGALWDGAFLATSPPCLRTLKVVKKPRPKRLTKRGPAKRPGPH